MPETDTEILRERSLEFLRSDGLQIAEHLPLIEEPDELDPPSADRVATRAVILREIIRQAHAPRPIRSKRFLEEHGCWDEVAPSEREVLARRRRLLRPLLSMHERAWMSWRVEALVVLLWGLGLVEITHRQGPALDLSGSMPETDGEALTDFIRSAKLRPSTEVRQQCDLLYCIHNGVRSLSVPRSQITTDLIIDPGVIYERHYAINWLAGVYADWDDVDTST